LNFFLKKKKKMKLVAYLFVLITVISKCFAIRWCAFRAKCSDNPKYDGKYYIGYIYEDEREYRKCSGKEYYCYIYAFDGHGGNQCELYGPAYTGCYDRKGNRKPDVFPYINSFDHY